MQIFITGTDTDVGKTVVSSWLCLHSGYAYYKPIQTGSRDGLDSDKVSLWSGVQIQKESYLYEAPKSPHLASRSCGETIDFANLQPASSTNTIVEGAGGVFVPINSKMWIVDLIKHWSMSVILVASSRLGTINHTLLTLEALRSRNINVLGVIISCADDAEVTESIAFYGKTKILAEMPRFSNITRDALQQFPLNATLHKLLGGNNDIS